MTAAALGLGEHQRTAQLSGGLLEHPVGIVGRGQARQVRGELLRHQRRDALPAHAPGNRVAQVFRREVSQAGFIWAAGTFAFMLGAVTGIDGLEIPIWLLLANVVGIVGLVHVRLRWRRLNLASDRTQVDDPSRPDRPRLASTTWEVAILGAGAGGLLVWMRRRAK